MRTGVCVAGSALALSPLGLTACGSGGARSLDALAKAAAKTSEQPSEHMTIYATIATDGHVSTVEGSGDFRNRPSQGRMDVDAAAVGWGDIPMHEIVNGSVAYLSSDGFFGELPPGKQWLAVDSAGAGNATGASTASAVSQTPLQALARLRAAGAARRIGTEDVDGVLTTHYAATIDPSKIPAGAVRAARPRYRSVDVWVDGRGLVRREMLAISETVRRSHVTASMKIDLSRFGEPVTVRTPSPDETSGATQLRLNAILNGGS